MFQGPLGPQKCQVQLSFRISTTNEKHSCIIFCPCATLDLLIRPQFWHFDFENRCQPGLNLASSKALSDLKKARIKCKLASASQQSIHKHSCIIFCPCATLDWLISTQFWHFDLENRCQLGQRLRKAWLQSVPWNPGRARNSLAVQKTVDSVILRVGGSLDMQVYILNRNILIFPYCTLGTTN